MGAEENETILLVEDDADLRTYLADVLRGLEYNVIAVAGAEAALDLLAKSGREIDLLLTDIVMPSGKGRELATAAQRLRPEMQVLFMTGYSRNSVVHQGRLDGDVDLLQKPVRRHNSRAAFGRRSIGSLKRARSARLPVGGLRRATVRARRRRAAAGKASIGVPL